MTDQQSIVVLYCIDRAFLPQAGIALASLLDSTPQAKFEVLIAVFNREPELFDAVFGAVLAHRPNCGLQFIDLDEDLFETLPVTTSFSRSIYSRIILARLADPSHARVLYLDADTIVREDIRSLWHADLGDATIGAAPDHFRLDLRQIGFGDREFYFNSGLMLVDMDRWRGRDCERRVLNILRRHARDLPWTDQDALNIALRGDVRALPLQWNWQPRCADVPASFLGLTKKEYDAARVGPALVHYTTPFKPWNAAYRVHYSALYLDAMRASGIPNQYLPASPSPHGVDQQLMRIKRNLRWRVPRSFRAVRKLLRPTAAAAMYRAGPGD